MSHGDEALPPRKFPSLASLTVGGGPVSRTRTSSRSGHAPDSDVADGFRNGGSVGSSGLHFAELRNDLVRRVVRFLPGGSQGRMGTRLAYVLDQFLGCTSLPQT